MKKSVPGSLIFLCSLCLLISVGFAYAGHDEIPRISIEELKQMIDNRADIVIVDSQQKEIYDRGHIRGAISLPWRAELSAADVRHVPRTKLIVTYCDCGPGETDSSDLAAQLLDLGFGDIRILADPSVRGWKKAGYPMDKQ